MTDAMASREVSRADAESTAQLMPLFERKDSQGSPIRSFRQASWDGIKERLSGVDSTNCRFVVRVRGHLEEQVLAAALRELRERHEVLRATVKESAGQPWLVFDAQTGWEMERADVAYLPRAQRESAARSLASELVWRPMDPATGPLFRAFLLTLDSEDHVLGLVVHQFIADTISMRLLSEELIRSYSLMAAGHRPSQSRSGLRYRDYLLGMTEWVEQPPVRSRLTQWAERFAGCMPMKLVEHTSDIPLADRGCVRYRFEIGTDVSARVASTARQLQTSKFVILLAAQQMLLTALTSHETVTLGAVTAGRDLAALEPIVGYLVDRLYWNTRLADDPSFIAAVERVEASYQEALRYPFFRSDLIQQELSRRGRWLQAPVFNFIPYSRPRPNVANDRFSWFEVDPAPFSTIPLPGISYWLVITETSNAMRGDIRFPHGRPDELARQFVATLSLLSEDATRNVSAVRRRLGKF